MKWKALLKSIGAALCVFLGVAVCVYVSLYASSAAQVVIWVTILLLVAVGSLTHSFYHHFSRSGDIDGN